MYAFSGPEWPDKGWGDHHERTLNAPTQMLFWASVIIAIIALISLVVVPGVAFWLALIAYVVLAVGCVMKGA